MLPPPQLLITQSQTEAHRKKKMSSLTFRKIRQRTKRTKRLVRKMSTLGKTRMLNCMMGLIQTAGAQGD